MWLGPASWSSGQGLWLLIMRSRVRFPVLPCEFFLQGKIPMVTMVWVVSRFRLKALPGISSSRISPLTSSGQRSRAPWASQTQKSATLSPQPGGKPRKFIRTYGGIGEKNNNNLWLIPRSVQQTCLNGLNIRCSGMSLPPPSDSVPLIMQTDTPKRRILTPFTLDWWTQRRFAFSRREDLKTSENIQQPEF